MTTSLSGFPGYEPSTFTYKTVDGIDIKLDILAPVDLGQGQSPIPIVMHYHGGFLIVGDRYSIPPSWLIQACVTRGWIFVSPDYRLTPEATAHESIEDALDAYGWVADKLAGTLGVQPGPIFLAGSSAGGYLALTTAALSTHRPQAVVSIYGLLDPANKRYTTNGTNILGIPPIETGQILEQFPPPSKQAAAPVPGYPWPGDIMVDDRFRFVMALHLEALIPDYLTGIPGLSKSLAAEGLDAIPESERRLFISAFGYPAGLPPVFLLHGKDDAAVPFEISEIAAEKLRQASVEVTVEFPNNAQHGFDAFLGRVDIEADALEESSSVARNSLKAAIRFLDQELSRG